MKEPEVASQKEGDVLSKLSDFAEHRPSDLLDKVLGAARQHLGMEVAFVSEYAEGQTVFDLWVATRSPSGFGRAWARRLSPRSVGA